MKEVTDYGVGPQAQVTAVEAQEMIGTADRFIASIAELLERGPA